MYLLPFYLHQSRHCESIAYLSSNYFTASAKRAQELSQDGALFAWRTIDGQETSAYYPAGTAQLHINADIVYAFQLYERVTGDVRFIEEVGSEVVFETAKFWLSYGDFIEKTANLLFVSMGSPDLMNTVHWSTITFIPTKWLKTIYIMPLNWRNDTKSIWN